MCYLQVLEWEFNGAFYPYTGRTYNDRVAERVEHGVASGNVGYPKIPSFDAFSTTGYRIVSFGALVPHGSTVFHTSALLPLCSRACLASHISLFALYHIMSASPFPCSTRSSLRSKALTLPESFAPAQRSSQRHTML